MIRRIIIILTAVLILVTFGSCSKAKNDINEATEFDINYSTEVSIPSASIAVNAPADFTTPQIPTQSATRFATERTAAELIDEIKLTRFNIINTTGNLDYLKSLTIYIKSDGMKEVMVAKKENIPAGSSTVMMDLNDVNIKEYIVKEKIQFRVAVSIDTDLTYDQKLKIEQTVKVKGVKIK